MKLQLLALFFLFSFSAFGEKPAYFVSAELIQQAPFNNLLKQDKGITIAYLPPATEYNFYLELGDQIQQLAEKHKFNYILKAPQSGSQWQKHVQMIKTMVENKVNIIIYSSFLPQTEAAIAPYIKQAVLQGTIVINVNSDELNLAYPVHALVGVNQRKSTHLLAQQALNILNGTSGKVAIIEGEHGQFSTERVGGFIDGLKGSGLEVVTSINGHWNAEGGYKATIQILNQFPDIKAIFAANDFEIIGALAAIKQLGRQDILLFGYDGVPDALSLIAEGQLTGTSMVNAKGLGDTAFNVLLDILASKFKGGFVEAQTQVITKDNVLLYLSDIQKASLNLIINTVEVVGDIVENSQNDDMNMMFIEIFREIYQSKGITVEFTSLPYKRAEHMVINKQTDVMVGNYRGNNNGVHFPQWHYASQEIVALFKHSRLNWQGIESLHNKRVAWIRGYGFEQYIPDDIKKISQTYRSQGLLMLDKNRVDVYIDDKTAIIKSNNKLKLKGLDLNQYQFAHIANLKLYPAFSRTAKGMRLARIFDQQLPALLSSGKLQHLFQKWGVSSSLFIQKNI